MHRNQAGPCRSQRGSCRAGKGPASPARFSAALLAACWLAFLPFAPSLHAAGGPLQDAGHSRHGASHLQQGASHSQQGGGVAGEHTAPSRELLDRYCVACHNERVVQGRGGTASPLAAQGASPPLDGDTDEVLIEYGYTAEEVAALRSSGAVGLPSED